MASNDTDWDTMLEIAKFQQQQYYELMPEWTMYLEEDYKYLKQNIGFAIYGPPTKKKDNDATKGNDMVQCIEDKVHDGSDITEALHYRHDEQLTIKEIFDKICELGEGYKHNKSICYGLIYNVTLRNKIESVTESTSKKAEKTNKDKKEEKTDKDKKEEEPDKINIRMTPIFKIKKKIVKESNHCKGRTYTTYDTWYIDIYSRVYKTWTDYKENNILPICTMVLPKDGVYQPDPTCDITEDWSVVRLEIVDSPASATSARILSGIDTLSNLVGIGGIGLGIASMLTPVGPAVLAASLVSTGANGLWTIGRSTQHLIDRNAHEQSISPTNPHAFSAWLGITGSTVGLAASGGAVLLSRVAQSGKNISNAAKMAYNSTLLCNIGINGIGIGYQAYNMYKRYQKDGTVDTLEILYFGTHILFFGNAVINLQFAGDLIRSSQGDILDDYRSNIRSKRLRKQFNRARRTAAANNLDKISENAEVIRHIKRKADLNAILRPNDVSRGSASTTNANSSSDSSNAYTTSNLSNVSFENGKLIVNGITLLDPQSYVTTLIRLRSFVPDLNSENSGPSTDGNDPTDGNTIVDLRNLLSDLLRKLFVNEGFRLMRRIPIVKDFESILQDMKHMKNADVILRNIFKIATSLMKKCGCVGDYLVEAIRFIWNYTKENLKQYCVNLCTSVTDSRSQALLLTIVTSILEALEMVLDQLVSAFLMYITKYCKLNFNGRT